MRVAIGPSSFGQADPAPVELLGRSGVELVENPFGRRLTADETIAHLRGADGLVAGLEPLTRDVLASAERLKAIARVGVGVDNVDLRAASDLGIKVSTTPDAPVDAVAEATIGSLIVLLRGFPGASAALHELRWEKALGCAVSDATVVVVGLGRIGRKVAGALLEMGATVLGVDPFTDEPPARVEMVDLLPGLSRADAVTLHADGVEPILDRAALAAIKEGCVVANPSRGALIDEVALIEALEVGTVRSAWLDTFEREPYTGPLTGYPQVVLTPHIATYTRGTRLRMEVEAVENLLRDLGIGPA